MMGSSLYCDRARMWASLAADGEISASESASLRAHTAVCPECAAWAARLVQLVDGMRAAPAVVPDRTFVHPVRSGRTRTRAIQLAASAAAIAAAVGLGHLAASLTAPSGGVAPSRAAIAATQEPYIEQQQLALLSRQADRGVPHGRMLPV